jgi:hypothetical protein
MGSGVSPRPRTRSIRIIRPELVPVLAAAAILTRIAYLANRDPLLLLVTVPLAWALAALVAYLAVWLLRAQGARFVAIAAPIALATLYVVMELLDLFVSLPGQVRAAFILASWGGLLVCWLWPDAVVALTGGPRPEWSLLRERAMLWLDLEAMSDDERRERVPEIEARVAALERYRTPATTEYIDLFRRLLLEDLAPDQGEVMAARFAELELSLRRSLRARPAWEDEVDARAREAGVVTGTVDVNAGDVD